MGSSSVSPLSFVLHRRTFSRRGLWSCAPPVAVAGVLWGLAHPPSVGVPPPCWTLAFNAILLLALFWLALTLGRVLQERIYPPSLGWPGSTALAITLGCGMFSLGLFVLGLLGLLYPALLAGVLLALALVVRYRALAAAWDLWRRIRTVSRPAGVGDWLAAFSALAMAAMVLVVLPRTVLPLHDFDALSYHQMGVRLYLAAHAMIPLSDFTSADGPINTELLFLLGAAFGSDTFSQMMTWGQGVLCSVLVVSLGRSCWGNLAGWLAGLAYVSIPLVPYFMPVPYNDEGLALGELSALVGLVALCSRPSPRGAVVCGLLLGFALGQKMSALPFTSALAAGALVLCLGHGPLWPALRALLLAGAVALLVALPWYVRDQVWFANPFMPLSVTAAEAPTIDLGPTSSLHALATNTTLPAPLGRLVDLFWFFWNWISPLALLAPLAVLVRPRRPGLAFLAVFCVGYIYWARYTPWNLPPRYLLCWMAALALCAGAFSSWLIGLASRRALLAVLLAAPLIELALLNVQVQVTFAGYQGVGAYLAGRLSRDTYLAGAVPPYAAIQELNKRDARDTVAVIGDARVYYITAPSIPDWGNNVLPSLEAQGSPQHAARTLWREGARYVLAADSLIAPHGEGNRWTAMLRDQSLVPLSHANGYTVYRLRPPPSG